MKKILLLCLMSVIGVVSMHADRPSGAAQTPGVVPVSAAGRKSPAAGSRQYSIIVNQTTDTLRLNSRLRHLNTNRGILMDLASGYLSMGTSTLLSASKTLVDMGIGMIKEAARDKRPDWEKAVNEESRFVKFLPMQTQVLDFYGKPSPNGALDPMDMKFSGFGCQQYVTVNDSEGKPHDEEVFYLSCRIREDDAGLARMLNHSKFEVVVDELRFNPYLCNLPNDSVNPDPATRIEFSFDKRKNLRFAVDAVITSSWINQAIQVHDNVELGRFHINALIDPSQLDADGVFRYNRDNADDAAKAVSVTGDCFLVPRSYVGSADMKSAADSWGTGQYKVNMVITETCQINDSYYTELKDGRRKWNKDVWGKEWKLIRNRRPRQSPWAKITSTVVPQFTGENWITTLAEPLSSVLLKHEGELVNGVAGKLSGTKGAQGAQGAQGAKGAQGAQGAQGSQGGQGAQKAQNPQNPQQGQGKK